jgi:hypothetical protein
MPGDPVALGQHADDLGMGVLADLADQGAAIGLGHPVVGLDPLLGVHAGLKTCGVFGILGPAGLGGTVRQRLRVHGADLPCLSDAAIWQKNRRNETPGRET